MRLGQLHDYLGALLGAGADEHTLICIPCDGVPSEVDRLMFAEGTYCEDASPAYPGFVHREGRVLVLVSGTDYPERLTVSHTLTGPEPVAPGKSWPSGDWRKK